MKINSSQKSHYPGQLTSTSSLPSSANLHNSNHWDSALADNPEFLPTDHTEIKAATSAHQSEPNQVHFLEHSPAASIKTSPAMALQNLEIPDLQTPETQDILDRIHQVENENIQVLLDGLQASLDRARKMMEENMRYYYERLRPQLDSIQQVLNQLRAQKTAVTQEQTEKLMQIAETLKTLQAEQKNLTSSPP